MDSIIRSYYPTEYGIDVCVDNINVVEFKLSLKIYGIKNTYALRITDQANKHQPLRRILLICQEIFEDEKLNAEFIDIPYYSANKECMLTLSKTQNNEIEDYYEMVVDRLNVSLK